VLRGLLELMLPSRVYATIEADTRKWLIECPCGHRRDLWEMGGIRYKAAGEPRRLMRCPHCGHLTWHKIRKKTQQESEGL